MALAEKLESLPLRPGVYLFKDVDGNIIYVGKARVLRDRVRSYFQSSRPQEAHKVRMVEAIADLDLVVTDTEMEAWLSRTTSSRGTNRSTTSASATTRITPT